MSWLMVSVLIVVLSLPQPSAIPIGDFYPYGADHGDNFLPSGDDNFSDPPINISFPFVGTVYGTISVSFVHSYIVAISSGC